MLESIKAHLKAYEKNGVDKGCQSIDQFRVRLTKEKTHGIVNYQLSNLLDPQQRYEIETALSSLHSSSSGPKCAQEHQARQNASSRQASTN